LERNGDVAVIVIDTPSIDAGSAVIGARTARRDATRVRLHIR